MVSFRSLQPFVWALNFGYCVGAIPAVWDPINFRIVFKPGQSYRVPFCHSRTPRSGYIFGGIYLAIQILNVLYLSIFLLCLKHSNIDFYMASFLLGSFLFATTLQMLAGVYFEDFINMFNTFLFLDLKIRK